MNTELIRKYNVAGPRYTSYPTVPFWDNIVPEQEQWKHHLLQAYDREEGLSIYIHLPYCESLCTYCGCNTRITVNHQVERPYIETVLAEWQLYKKALGQEKILIKELHLGGGTPTFFSSESLEVLVNGILEDCELAPTYEFGFEGHPNNTTYRHLQVLYNLGFRRVSFGIQDFDYKVQKTINRIQPYQNVLQVTQQAREIGYTSINYDLIYGLPFQTADTIKNTFELVVALKPDRIAYYSYAHVPWMKPGQRSYTEADLPTNEVKRSLYELGKELLEQADYQEVGMDHFALKKDDLYQALVNKSLHRNFMGYTTQKSSLVVGLGASAISDTWSAFGQNIKAVEAYRAAVEEGKFPIFRGHMLSKEDLSIRAHILNLMCHYGTNNLSQSFSQEEFGTTATRLQELVADGLCRLEGDSIQVSEAGRPFIRNICMALDSKLWKSKPETLLFSSTI
jgi:oxygen-independent coproporphyrinogen-3 oxidase